MSASSADELELQHQHVDSFFVICLSGVIILALLLSTQGAALLSFVIGVPPLVFMIYVVLSSKKANKAKKVEEANEINAIKKHLEQCEKTLQIMDITLKNTPADYRMYMALNHLADVIILFTSQYRRYIDENAANAALDAEMIIITAEITRDRSLQSYIAPIGDYVRVIKDGVLTVNSSSLSVRRTVSV